MLVSLSSRRTLIGGILLLLMIATRGHHFPTVQHLVPSAAWAVFFLGGFYLRSALAFGLFLAAAAGIDYAAIAWGGVDDFCVSPAYAALLHAYGALWLAGRWYGRRHADAVATLLPLSAAVIVGGLLCELISSASFYFLSGRFADTSLGGFAVRLVQFFPSDLGSLALWVAVAAVVHGVATARRGGAVGSANS